MDLFARDLEKARSAQELEPAIINDAVASYNSMIPFVEAINNVRAANQALANTETPSSQPDLANLPQPDLNNVYELERRRQEQAMQAGAGTLLADGASDRSHQEMLDRLREEVRAA